MALEHNYKPSKLLMREDTTNRIELMRFFAMENEGVFRDIGEVKLI